ncbi:hypothetical protein DL98DRAFT_554866 [Cadophora sp. DSE1049]|nr:hypothetical protein DL98DRAFT_554866 [Cadophora sp. DSE1049]
MSSRRDSDFARLEQLLLEERRNRQEADERAELERQRAEQERRRAEEQEERTRRTTYEEYIRACHTLLSKPLRIQTDKSLSTQGSITSPKNKPCPTLLKPWRDFLLGQDICDRLLASEKDLEAYQRLAVERPTTHIISYFQRIKEARHTFDLGEGIIFENHANTFSNSNEEV